MGRGRRDRLLASGARGILRGVSISRFIPNTTKGLKHAHAVLTVLWLLVVPLSIATGWLWSIAFISACSIYANAAGHAAAWQASRGEEKTEER